MIEIKTVGEDIKVNIEGESEDLLHELAQIGSALYNAARSGLEEGYYDDTDEDDEDEDDECELCEIKRGEHFFYNDIGFICLESGADALFAITANCIGEYEFDKDGKNDWRICSLNKWLNNEYLSEHFDKKHLICREIDLTADNGDKAYGIANSYLAPLTVDEYRKCRDIVPLFDECMWTVTPWHCGTPNSTSAGYVRYVNTSGALSYYYAGNANGLAPACIFDLTILSSRRLARTGRVELYEEGY